MPTRYYRRRRPTTADVAAATGISPTILITYHRDAILGTLSELDYEIASTTPAGFGAAEAVAWDTYFSAIGYDFNREE